MALDVELVAVDRTVWRGEARQVVARTTDGELGILPGHAPLLGVLGAGQVRISAEQPVTVEVDSGFLSVDHDRVTIVVGTASTDIAPVN
ncbi:MAG: F0F1 ATP synthase subunit epsilon [Actinomycetota bacterium]